MVARMLTPAQVAALVIPTVDEIRAAAYQIPQLDLGTWQAYDTRRSTFLEVAPGLVRLTRSAAHLKDASVDRALSRRFADSRYQLAAERAVYSAPMAFVTDSDLRAVDAEPAPLIADKRITSFSRKSRSRMQQQLRRIDYRQLFDDGLEPAMITLTMPGLDDDGDPDYWQTFAPTPAAFKRLVDRFTTDYRAAWGRPYGVWKMEFQRRGAPHLHILLTPPAGVSAGKLDGLHFDVWLGRAWARIVGSTGRARVLHEQRGSDIEYVGEKYRNPRTIASYFGKHGLLDKGYQNDMPQIWLDAIAAGSTGARFWGVWGLPKASAVVVLDDRGSATVETLIDPLRVQELAADIKVHYRRNDDGSWELVSDRPDWAHRVTAVEGHVSDSDASWGRQAARSVVGSASPDDVRVRRYMRKLSASLAHRGVQHVRNDLGQPILPPDSIRRVKYERTDALTGVVRTVRRYRVGYFHGSSGYVLVEDGRVTARDIARLLGASWDLAA